MKRVRIVVLASLAVFAFGAIAATSAQAVEGPFYKVGGKRLAKGETKEIEAKLLEGRIVLLAGTVEVLCTGVDLEKGAKIIGSNGANPGTSEEKVLFTGCIVNNNGASCKVVGEKIITNTLVNTLDFQNEKPVKGERILTLFKPKEGAVLAKIELTGECTIPSTPVEGSFAAQADFLNSVTGKIEFALVEEEPAEAELGLLK